MNIVSWIRHSFKGMSLQKRLPLLIFILLLCIIIIFSTIAYVGVKNDAEKTGHARLQSLTLQLSSLFGQSAQALMTAMRTASSSEAVKRNLLSGGKEQKNDALNVLENLGQDKQSVMVALLDNNYKTVLKINKDSLVQRFNYDSVMAKIFITTDSSSVGRLYFFGRFYLLSACSTSK